MAGRYFVSVPVGPKVYQGYEVHEGVYQYIRNLEHLVAFHDIVKLQEIYPDNFKDFVRPMDPDLSEENAALRERIRELESIQPIANT